MKCTDPFLSSITDPTDGIPFLVFPLDSQPCFLHLAFIWDVMCVCDEFIFKCNILLLRELRYGAVLSFGFFLYSFQTFLISFTL